MNSIKNAIVTITLLAVGYGSYLVLQNPPDSDSFQDFAASNAKEPTLAQPSSETLAGDQHGGSPGNDFDVKIEIDDASEPEPKSDAVPLATPPLLTANTEDKLVEAAASQNRPSLDFPEVPQPAAGSSRFSGYESDFADSATAAPMAEPAVTATAIPEEDVLGDAPRDPDPNTGPFSTPVVVDVSPTEVSTDSAPGLEAHELATPNKVDTSSSSVADVDIPPMNDALGPIPPADSEGSSEFETSWLSVQQQLRDRDLVKALSGLSPWASDSTLNQAQRTRCLHLLDQLAGTVIYSREHHLEPEYVVQAGETLEEIAAAHNVPQGLLARINGIARPYALTTGETLKLVRGPFRAEISLFKNELTLYVGSNYAGRFPVTIGPDLPPEEAFYEVAEKSNGRSYFDRRTGNEVTRRDEANRYGNHWLGLRGEHITTGHSVGIHGRPAKFTPDNAGSISLNPLHAEDVFSILSVGSRVQVRR